ncbi:ATP-binding protein [Gallionella capsiferriformans]|uniref:histidine kinase n=1 Tax=Gallionella capsiferriformans (strain ES-2) TaxID=395494 RepID=D9SDN6_GALCS|nr:ATP-binding protein [Gallionella capsiferriformans]ADL54793.1 multi-sensor signal transduction histidine kinase [Gallionella capsiferriformans ES-2]
MRIRTKTILGIATIELVLLAILVGSALSVLRESNEAELMRRVQLGGVLLASAAKDAVISQDLATLDSLVIEAMNSGQIDMVRIVDADGVILAQRGDAAVLARPFHKEVHPDQVNDGILDWSSTVSAGGIQHGEVQLGIAIAPLTALLNSARHWAAGIASLEMLLVALFSWLLGSYLTRQLIALREASKTFSNGNFDHRLPISGDDELTQTATAFNLMAQKIGESHIQLINENQLRVQSQQDAEQAQALAEDIASQLKEIFALSPDGFVSFNGEHLVKYVSPAFSRLTGLTEEDVIGINEITFFDRLKGRCIKGADFPDIATLHDNQTSLTDRTPVKKRQRQIIELSNGRILEIGLRESKSETVSQILYLRNITHETEVDRLKSEFLSTAAHELRTPMASIYGYSELLLTREFSHDEQHEFLSTIYRQSELMISIINELLDIARIEARGSLDFTLTQIDLYDLLNNIIAGCKPPNGRKCPQQPQRSTPLWVAGDRRKLTQAISNVLSNAYKYSSDEVGIEFLTSDLSGHLIGLRISDRGIGMTAEQLSHVFERFYRADDSGKFPGTGLGMSIVQEIITLHGGHIDIESQSGTGTIVTLWIPAATD